MPASMMSAATGLRLKVIGSSMAMVATGPMPGSTPISVPSITPIRQYSKCIGEIATPKPRIRLLKISIAASADRAVFDEARADRERQRQPFHEHQHREHDQDQEQDGDLFPFEFVAAVSRDEHQQESGAD